MAITSTLRQLLRLCERIPCVKCVSLELTALPTLPSNERNLIEPEITKRDSRQRLHLTLFANMQQFLQHLLFHRTAAKLKLQFCLNGSHVCVADQKRPIRHRFVR